MTFHEYLVLLYSLCLFFGTVGMGVSIITATPNTPLNSPAGKKAFLAVFLLVVGVIGLFLHTGIATVDDKTTGSVHMYASVSYPDHYNSPAAWRVKSNGHWGYERW